MLYRLWKRIDRDEGQALVEYALIITFIATVAVGALNAIGTGLPSMIAPVSGAL